MKDNQLIHKENFDLDTQTCDRVECKKRLLGGRKFTHDDFINEVGNHRLATHIHVLRRKHGWDIKGRRIQVYNARTQRMNPREQYYLELGEIERIKKAQADAQAK